MTTTVIIALLPIVVTLMLGYFAGWHHDVDKDQAGVLNRMVMSYALPLVLFSGIVTTPFSRVTDNGPLFLWIAIGMIGGFGAVVVVCRYVLHDDLGVAALRALAIAGPAVPFVGIPVLGALYPDEADIAVAAGSLIMNLVQVPIALVLLTAAAGPGGVTPGTGRPASSSFEQLGGILVDTFKKAVVWAPILAFVLILVGINLPTRWDGSFTLLGQATGGVALFAVGAVLYAQKIGFSRAIVVNVVMKNVVLPAAVLGGMVLAGVEGDDLGLSVVTIAIPTASIAVIFAVQYGKAEREMATTLFASTILSVVTMGAFIEITDAIK